MADAIRRIGSQEDGPDAICYWDHCQPSDTDQVMEASWNSDPFAVHVTSNTSIAEKFTREARESGASVIKFALSEASDRDALNDLLARTFLFPHMTRGLDAAADLISDLEWFDNARGYLVITELAGASKDVVAAWSQMVPAIINRWRAQGMPFVAVMVDGENSEHALLALVAGNARLKSAGELPWAQPGTGPVDVFDHRVQWK